VEVDGGGYLQEIESGGVCGEDMETFMEDRFEVWKARIVGGDEEVGVGGLRGLDGMREEDSGNLVGDEGRGITSVEEGLVKVSGVGVKVIRVTADVLHGGEFHRRRKRTRKN